MCHLFLIFFHLCLHEFFSFLFPGKCKMNLHIPEHHFLSFNSKLYYDSRIWHKMHFPDSIWAEMNQFLAWIFLFHFFVKMFQLKIYFLLRWCLNDRVYFNYFLHLLQFTGGVFFALKSHWPQTHFQIIIQNVFSDILVHLLACHVYYLSSPTEEFNWHNCILTFHGLRAQTR